MVGGVGGEGWKGERGKGNVGERGEGREGKGREFHGGYNDRNFNSTQILSRMTDAIRSSISRRENTAHIAAAVVKEKKKAISNHPSSPPSSPPCYECDYMHGRIGLT